MADIDDKARELAHAHSGRCYIASNPNHSPGCDRLTTAIADALRAHGIAVLAQATRVLEEQAAADEKLGYAYRAAHAYPDSDRRFDAASLLHRMVSRIRTLPASPPSDPRPATITRTTVVRGHLDSDDSGRVIVREKGGVAWLGDMLPSRIRHGELGTFELTLRFQPDPRPGAETVARCANQRGEGVRFPVVKCVRDVGHRGRCVYRPGGVPFAAPQAEPRDEGADHRVPDDEMVAQMEGLPRPVAPAPRPAGEPVEARPGVVAESATTGAATNRGGLVAQCWSEQRCVHGRRGTEACERCATTGKE